MPRVPFTAFLQGPAAVYTSSTGQSDPRTGTPYLGTDLIQGNFADLSNADAQVWNRQYGTKLYGGRYRFVALDVGSTAANLDVGRPVGWMLGTSVQNATVTAAGSGYTAGTYTLQSSASGSQVAATIQVVIGSAGTLTNAGVSVVNGGSGFTANTVPSVSTSTLPGGSSGTIALQLQANGDIVSSFDSNALSTSSLVRGLCITPAANITSAIITAGAWIVIQESGIGSALVTTATGTAAGIQAIAITAGAVTTRTAAYSDVEIGTTLDLAAVGDIVRVQMSIPMLPW